MEIKKHIEYYVSHCKSNGLSDEDKTADKLLLYGGGVELSGLSEALSKNLKIEILTCLLLFQFRLLLLIMTELSADNEDILLPHKIAHGGDQC